MDKEFGLSRRKERRHLSVAAASGSRERLTRPVGHAFPAPESLFHAHHHGEQRRFELVPGIVLGRSMSRSLSSCSQNWLRRRRHTPPQLRSARVATRLLRGIAVSRRT